MERSEPEENPSLEGKLRKYLLLQATLVAGVTYLAGINPPGGVWQENGSGHKAGDAILLATDRHRYLVFCCGNATALAASVVVLFLLLLKKPRYGIQFAVLRLSMMVNLVGLIVACIAGSSLNTSSTIYIRVQSVSAVMVLACIVVWNVDAVIVLVSSMFGLSVFQFPQGTEEDNEELYDRAALEPKERRKLLMLLATFIAAITYVAGLSSSGGYWGRVESKGDRLVLVNQKAKARYNAAFVYCNAAAFMSSLFVVTLLLFMKRIFFKKLPVMVMYVIVPVAPLGLLGAYAGGTCRTDTSFYVFLISAFLAYIFLVIVRISIARWRRQSTSDASTELADGIPVEASRNVKSLILLLAALTATVTYQAGLNPPGGAWPDDRDGHGAGFPILLSTHPWRYKVFISCNSGAFVLSLASILMLMVHNEKIHIWLLASMILDMVSLMVAYAAGTWRDARSSIYVVVAMSGGVIFYVMIHLLCATLRTPTKRLMKKRHKRLLLVAVMVTTITYQAGLNPPGGFRREEDDGHAAGAVLLMDSHPRSFLTFFYCNTVSFLATVALTLFLVSPNLQRFSIRCYALYACIVLASLGLMAAYAARTQIRIFVSFLLVFVVSIIGFLTIWFRSLLLKIGEEEEEDEEGSSTIIAPATLPRPRSTAIRRPRPRHRHRLRSAQETEYRQVYASHKYSMLLAVVAAGATYQAGLAPPGGLWQDDGEHGDAGSPVLYYKNKQWYNAFFYSNSTSFVLSVLVVTLQLQHILYSPLFKNRKRALVLATRMALVLDMLCLLAAYAAGTTWWLGNAIPLVVVVLALIFIILSACLLLSFACS